MKCPVKSTLYTQSVGKWLPKAGVGMGINYNWHKRFYWGDENAINWIVAMVAQLCKFIRKCHTENR